MPASDRALPTRALSLLLAVFGGTAVAVADGTSFMLPAKAGDAEASGAGVRLEAATEALRRRNLPSDPLTAAALAADFDALVVEPGADGAFRVRQPDERRTRALADAMSAVHARHGAPRVVVEPSRPGHPSDREAASAVTDRLRAAGFETSDARAAQASRRSAADRAVQAGVDPARAAQALEAHPDFVVRVQVQETLDEESKPTYGIVMKRCEARLRFDVVHGGDATRVTVPEVPVTRFGRDPSTVRSMAVTGACEAAGTPLALALAHEWLERGTGARGQVVEIDGTPAAEPMRSPRPVEVLEAVPGVRTVIRLPPGDPRSVAQFGTPLLERPGYALVDARDQGAGWRTMLGVAAAAIAAVGLALAAWKMRPRASA